LQLKPSDILAVTRGSPADAHARQAAMYLAHVALGISLTAIGRFFARDHSTVAHGCRCVEDRRDDPAFDTLIGELALAARIALHLDCEVTA
jgi:chromosomal replication initiation ATPase DnaA